MTHRVQTGMIVGTLVLAAMTLTYPFLVKGLPDGHDRPDHIAYQHYFNDQMAQGAVYPRWVPEMNQGRGGAIFLAQYPLPYYVAWGIGHVIPNHWGIYTETRTQGLAIALAAILGALFTYVWCSTFVDRRSAMLAAIVFLTLPYFLAIDLYMRVAVGEIWALAMMPLALYFVELRASRPRIAIPGLGLAFALVLVSHFFTAALFVPVLLVFALWRSAPERRWSAMGQTVVALALGTGIAGVYVVPMLAQYRYFHPDRMLVAYGARLWPLSQMFAYDANLFPSDDLRWKSLTHIAQAVAVVAILLIGRACYRRRTQLGYIRVVLAVLSLTTLVLALLAGHLGAVGNVPGSLSLPELLARERSLIFLATFLTLEVAVFCYWSLRRPDSARLANFFLGLALASYLMTTRWSLIVWKLVHPLWNVQFPWRFNVYLALAAVGLAALAVAELRTRPLRARVVGALLALALCGMFAILPAWRGRMRPKFFGTQPVAYQPAQDYGLPTYAQVSDPQDALGVKPSKDGNVDAIVTVGSGQAWVNSVSAKSIGVHALCDSNCTLQIGQFYYPAWNAKLLPALTTIPLVAAADGLMSISLPPGEHNILLEFEIGWSQPVGAGISVACLMLAGGLVLVDDRRRRVRRADVLATARV
jgi:hypothetical protein